jgi:ADP-heptose:LPS heptosyltransferase
MSFSLFNTTKMLVKKYLPAIAALKQKSDPLQQLVKQERLKKIEKMLQEGDYQLIKLFLDTQIHNLTPTQQCISAALFSKANLHPEAISQFQSTSKDELWKYPILVRAYMRSLRIDGRQKELLDFIELFSKTKHKGVLFELIESLFFLHQFKLAEQKIRHYSALTVFSSFDNARFTYQHYIIEGRQVDAFITLNTSLKELDLSLPEHSKFYHEGMRALGCTSNPVKNNILIFTPQLLCKKLTLLIETIYNSVDTLYVHGMASDASSILGEKIVPLTPNTPIDLSTINYILNFVDSCAYDFLPLVVLRETYLELKAPILFDKQLLVIPHHFYDEELNQKEFFDFEHIIKLYAPFSTKVAGTSLNATHAPTGVYHKLLIGLGSGLGNALQMTPFIHYFYKQYNAKIDIILENSLAYMQETLQLCNQVNNIFTQSTFKTQEYYDVSIFLKTSESATIWVPSVSYVNLEALYPLMTYTRLIHEAEYPFWCFKQLNFIKEYTCDQYSDYFVSNTIWSRADCDNSLILFHAGCKDGKWDKKKWPYFKILAKKLISIGYSVASLGSAHEYVEGTINYTGLPLIKTVETIKKGRVMIANDSGVMHIADALKIPLLTLFGPSSAIKNRPLSVTSTFIESHLACSPCQFSTLLETCRDNLCIKNIEVECIYNKLIQLLEQKDMSNVL